MRTMPKIFSMAHTVATIICVVEYLAPTSSSLMPAARFLTGLLLAIALTGAARCRDDAAAHRQFRSHRDVHGSPAARRSASLGTVALGADGTRAEIDGWLNCAAAAYAALRPSRPRPQAAELSRACAAIPAARVEHQSRRWSAD